MIHNPNRELKIVCSLVILLAIAFMPFGGMSDPCAQAAEPPDRHEAPLRPPSEELLPPRTGGRLPEMDLSHLTGQEMPERLLAQAQALPTSWDWRTQGKVTPVKDQGGCGACYAFAAIGNIESKMLMDGAGSHDFSENNAKECNWRELNNYVDYQGHPWGSCAGGDYRVLASLFSQKGVVLESCDQYVASDVGCKGTCTYQKTLLDWRLVCGDVIPDTDVLKSYIQTYGPVQASMYVDESQGFDPTYDGSYTFDYWKSPGVGKNHDVLIVGWSNNLPPVTGGITPADGWIVKNSWGEDWGDDGYFYITYGAANIGMYSSFMYDWQDYDNSGGIMYYDEDGWSTGLGYGDTTGWGLVKFFPSSDTNVTRVEFWTTDKTTDVDVYIYDDFDGTAPSNLLWSSLNHSFNEAGYHGLTVSPPLAVNSGDDVIAVVRFTNQSDEHPIPLDDNSPHETERTYSSSNGSTWYDEGVYGDDVAIRLRTSAGAAPNDPPDTPSNPSPTNHATGVSVNANLSWTGGDPNAGDTVTYDVYFGTSASPPVLSNDQTGTTYDPGTLSYNTKYYWKIVATDNHGVPTVGPLWDFTTSSPANNPPQLSSPSVQPPSGTPSTSFYYYVNYYDSDGDSPSVKQVYIDGTAYTMSLQSGSASNGTYRYGPENLSVGSYNYYFYFEDGKGGTARLPASDSYSGPVVSQENNPPNTPSNPSPPDHATGISVNADLSWTGADPDAGDTVTYDVYFGTSASPPLLSDDQTGTAYDPGTLSYNTKYYWKIVATDNHGAPTAGPLWDFTTGAPGPPDIAVSPTSFEVTLPQDTTQDYPLNISNTGGATLTYIVTDRETTGGTSTSGVEGFAIKPAGIVLEIPSESEVVEPDRAAEAQTGWQNILTDGFEGEFPGAWDADSTTGYAKAYWGKDGSNPHDGSYSAFCAKIGSDAVIPPADYPNNMDAWMVYGPFALCDATDAELNFYYWLDTQSEHDYLRLMASVNGTVFYGLGWSGDSGGWVSESFDLTHVYALGDLCGRCYVWIAFAFTSDEDIAGQGAFIDDVVLRKYVNAANSPPNTPSNPSPANHATDVSMDADLSWTGGDPDPGDIVAYDVYFGTAGSVTRVSIEQPECTYDPGTLNSDTTYYWKIVARDGYGAATIGPFWDFTTAGVPGNNPPNSPSNPSPANDATRVQLDADLSWTGGDPDPGDTVTYDVYFGTTTSPPLVSDDQPETTYDPGTLDYSTEYYWKVAATDNHLALTEGPLWGFTTTSGDCAWLDESLKSSSVQPGSSDSITVTIDTTGLTDGDYSAEIVIPNNDPDENPKIVPVILHVTLPGANNPPNLPSSPAPANHATDVSINTDLSWTGGDPDPGDTVTYDVYFGTSPILLSPLASQSATSYDPGMLSYDTTYYWKIIATDNHEAPTAGPVWDFSTEAEPGPGTAWNFPSTSDVFLGPTPDNGRPYLDAAVPLPTGTEPEELSGVYWLDEATGEWQYFIPAYGSGTLTSLEPGQNYVTAVSGACSWNLPCGEGTASPTGNVWNFPSTSDVFVGPTPANSRPYLDAAVALPTYTEPAELSGVYWLDEATGEWQYFIPAYGGGTLTSLEPGQVYLMTVSGACSWNLPQQ